MAKKILGLDLGTTSIGWAIVTESEDSKIEKVGVRVNPLSTDERNNFNQGKGIGVNAERTRSRSLRRNLDRYQLRRKALVETLIRNGIIDSDSVLTESGSHTTFETWKLRARAVREKIELDQFARVLLAINKKRGYKSNRKIKDADVGSFLDGMAVANELRKKQLTPGQLVYQLLQEEKMKIPEFYQSDLREELEKVWTFQRQFYPDILTDEFRGIIEGQGKRASISFRERHGVYTADVKASSKREKLLQAYRWRSLAVTEKLSIEELAFVIVSINGDISKSSSYLGAIGDRSKELNLAGLTVGEFSYQALLDCPHNRLKGLVFYRQDYISEFEKIWDTQSQFYPQLTTELKEEIRDRIIFFQRPLRSQKGLLSFCELESKEIKMKRDDKAMWITIGSRVAPRSSLLFQEFKIWQMLNNLRVRSKTGKEELVLDMEAKQALFEELNIKGSLSIGSALKWLGCKPSEWEANYSQIEGNWTNKVLFEAYLQILEMEEALDKAFFSKEGELLDLSRISMPAHKILSAVEEGFVTLGIDTSILKFDPELDGKDFEKQPSYQLWHLLYSYEGDDSQSGNEKLYELLQQKYGFQLEHARILGRVSFVDGHCGLSTKAMRKIYPFLKEMGYDKACYMANYNHSAMSLTKDENINRPLATKLRSIRRNELRNPVVEKILNQMVNLVNDLIDLENANRREQGISEDFHFDEIRIELARELKASSKDRELMHKRIGAAERKHKEILSTLQTEFGIKNPSRSDIVRFKLYEELKNNGYKDLYTNRYIPREILFSHQIDVDHIIPRMSRFDDSLSNKTLSFSSTNREKGNRTAFDFISERYGDDYLAEYEARLRNWFESGGISKAKYLNLLKRGKDIGDGFIERDLRESQYIAKVAKRMLLTVCRSVVSTSGQITAKLRQDWGLVNLMQEINLPRYRMQGLTEQIERRDGSKKEIIKGWTKRDDHRHHAVDAIAIAFTKRSYIEYLNYLNARKDSSHQLHHRIMAIEEREMENFVDEFGNRSRRFIPPMNNFRAAVRDHILGVLVSHKAKNKVVTRNKNRIRTKSGVKVFIERTPRGPLHKETIYKRYLEARVVEERINSSFDMDKIESVINPLHKRLLLARLNEFNNDPKKAFSGKNSLRNHPLFLDQSRTATVPEKVKVMQLVENFSKKVVIDTKLTSKNIEKVLDGKCRELLLGRLNEYGGDPKKAFADLEREPIWFNKEKRIPLKRVTMEGVRNAIPIHSKRDHFGKYILDVNGSIVPNSYVSLGNNHHVAIFQDDEGQLKEQVVSFFEAVIRVNAGLPIVDKNFNREKGWRFLFTMKQNEMFVFPNELLGFWPREIDLRDLANKSIISPNLYRVQKIATRDYYFRHHIETNVEDVPALKGLTYKRILSPNQLAHIVKVRINSIGQIVQIGEY